MLNWIWIIMVLLGVVIGAFGGRIQDVTNGTLDSAGEAVAVAIKTAGIVAMWSGLMNVAEKSGLIKSLVKLINPILRFLFPRVPTESKAMEYIATNFIANVLGLGWAATPAGLSAMQELHKMNPNKDKTVASREMCMFLIINMSSLQLVTVNLLAYRSQFNSANPSEIIGPGLAATIVSSIAAVAAAKFFEFLDKKKETYGYGVEGERA